MQSIIIMFNISHLTFQKHCTLSWSDALSERFLTRMSAGETQNEEFNFDPGLFVRPALLLSCSHPQTVTGNINDDR